jgi:TatA/E family protein of Tat protein translocase
MLSIPHLIIIFVVALVVFGPEKLPDLARNLGKVMSEFRRATGELRSTFEGHMRDLEREADVRRIGGGAGGSSASTAAPTPAAAINPTSGTVPTIPAQPGPPIEGQKAATDETGEPGEVRYQPAPTQSSEPARQAESSEPQSETSPDGGARPA